MFTLPQMRHIMQQVERGLLHPSFVGVLREPSDIKCWTCKIGLNVAAATTIAAALVAIAASDGAAAIPEVELIAALTGLSEAEVLRALTIATAGLGAGQVTAVELAIEKLCQAMRACR